MKIRRGQPYSPHHWIRCKVHGVIPVSRSFPEEYIRKLIEEHKRHGD